MGYDLDMDDAYDARGHLTFRPIIENCTDDVTWTLNHVTQCIDNPLHILTLCLGIVATLFSCGSYLRLFCLHRKRHQLVGSNALCLFLVLHVLAESIALTGAVLTYQLPSQVVYSISMTSVTVLSIICATTTCIRGHANDGNEQIHRDARKKSRCSYFLCPVYLLFPISALYMAFSHKDLQQFITREITPSPSNNNIVPIKWLLGYLFGVMAAITKFCGKITDVYIAFNYVDIGQRLSRVLLSSLIGDLSYFMSVYTYSLSTDLIYLTLPWTLPRLIGAGIDAGIIIQRVLQDKSRKNRKLSQDDAERLLSSDVEISSDGSEEVIWMPLKAMDYARPQYSAGTTRMHIVSDSGSYAESTFEDTAYDGDSEARDTKARSSNGTRSSRSLTPVMTQQQQKIKEKTTDEDQQFRTEDQYIDN